MIIHAPEHVTSMADLSEERLRRRGRRLARADARARDSAAYLHLIVNEGRDAGASLRALPRSALRAPFVPAEVARERERTGAYHERTMGGHLLSDVARRRCAAASGSWPSTRGAMLVCPWASRSPFELRVIPRSPAPSFEADGEVGTAMIRTRDHGAGARVGTAPQLNLWVRTAPRGAEEFRWHVDIVPRLTIRAGFELGTGVDVNTYPPERAAADLREALGD